MKVVVTRTGLSPHVIRVWERRYGAVAPARTASNRRVFTEAEVERLLLLGRATRCGHSIGLIAALSTDALREMLVDAIETDAVVASPERDGTPFVEAAFQEVRRLDAPALDKQLAAAARSLGPIHFLERVVRPLMWRIGEAWHTESLRVSAEHLASAAVRTFLGVSRMPSG